MARGGIPASPLPPRHGVDAQRFRLPGQGPWSTLLEHLVERLALPADQVERLIARGEFVDAQGNSLSLDAPFVPHAAVWAHRPLPAEQAPPGDVRVVFQDERIVVIDKPHFMASMPRGRHIRYSALARTRVLTGLDRLAPAHRLDRPTAGLLLFTTEQRWRGAYQGLFASGAVHKEYRALAPVRESLRLPMVRRTHIVKEHGVLQAHELAGVAPNAETFIELEAVVSLADGTRLGSYRLTPRTGRTHQLRCQLSELGIPIVNDDLYPNVVERAVDDYSAPLQLVAHVLEFTDPIDGTPRRFQSRCRLLA